MTRVKICGITNLADALAAAEDGADALGFVFWPRSPRRISPAKAAAIIRNLPPMVTPVGLFVNALPAEVKRIAKRAGLSVVQLHGDETPREVAALAKAGLKVIKAIPVGPGFAAKQLKPYRAAAAFLLDAHDPERRGGTGRSFDWQKAGAATRFGRLFLAGGLSPSNVARAIGQTRPYGVDVSSGVEKRTGVKNRKKVSEFIRRAKAVTF